MHGKEKLWCHIHKKYQGVFLCTLLLVELVKSTHKEALLCEDNSDLIRPTSIHLSHIFRLYMTLQKHFFYPMHFHIVLSYILTEKKLSGLFF